MLRVILLCLVTVFTGSASAQSLVGKWDCEGRDGPGMSIRTLQEYRANGLFYHRANMAIGNNTRRMDTSITLRGSWALKSNRIVENIRTARMTKLEENGRDVSRTPIGKRMGRDLPGQLAGRDGISRTRINFTSANRFEMVDGRLKGVCVRR